MKKECETFVIKLLPVIKRLLVRILIREYGLTQKEVAEKLNLSQPTVSFYFNQTSKEDYLIEKKIRKQLIDITKGVLKGEDFSKQMCGACYALTKTKCAY